MNTCVAYMPHKLLKWLYYLIQIPLYWLSRWIPPQQNLWVFGAWQGDRFADNTRFLYQYLRKHHPEIQAVWFSANPQVVSELRQRGDEAVAINSIRALWIALRARVAVVTHSLRTDIQPLIHSGKTLTVQLWHGIPLKKIGYDDTRFTNPPQRSPGQRLKQWLIETVFPFWKETYHLITTTSRHLIPIFASAFRHPREKIVVTGYPRNDALFHPTTPLSLPPGERAIIYMPTFRGGMGTETDLFTPYGFSLSQAETLLEKWRAHLFLRLHPVNHPPHHLEAAIHHSHRIHFFNEGDIHSVLAHFKVLITDFSSIYFDYLLLDRPIIFAPFDLEAYLQVDRELYFDYQQVTPGPKAQNWREVFQHLETIFAGEDPYKHLRATVRNQFHDFQDDRNSERVMREILHRL